MTLHPCFQPASPQLPIPTPLQLHTCTPLSLSYSSPCETWQDWLYLAEPARKLLTHMIRSSPQKKTKKIMHMHYEKCLIRPYIQCDLNWSLALSVSFLLLLLKCLWRNILPPSIKIKLLSWCELVSSWILRSCQTHRDTSRRPRRHLWLV